MPVVTVRKRIRDADSASGKYPTVARTGDARGGDHRIFFDDGRTVEFERDVTVSYPTTLKTGSFWLKPNLTSSLTALATASLGVADAFVERLDHAPVYLPFVEQNLWESASSSFGDPFWKTGSNPIDAGLGFSQPLSAKTKIVIDLTPSADTTFGYTEIPVAGNRGRTHFYPMVYFNFGSRQWERLGTGSLASGFASSSNADDVKTFLDRSMIGFLRGLELSVTGTRAACLPCTNFGFPVHPKFHATSSQLFSLSGSLRHPFLFEKFTYEFELSYSLGKKENVAFDRLLTYDSAGSNPDGTDALPTRHHASVSTFFILNQRQPYSASVKHTSFIQQNIGASARQNAIVVRTQLPFRTVLSDAGPEVDVNTSRDLVTFGQLVSVMDDNDARDGGRSLDRVLHEGLRRELTIDLRGEKGSLTVNHLKNSSLSRRELTMSGTVKQASAFLSGQGFMLMTSSSLAQTYFVTGANLAGGRTGVDSDQSGRSFVGVQPGARFADEPLHDLFNDYVLSQSFGTPIKNPIINVSVSPYLLHPSDRLSFGWQCPILADSSRILSGSPGLAFAPANGPQITLYSGRGKLTLYGSLIKNGREFHDTLNQLVSSDAIHETIADDDASLDQWDVESRMMLSSSYVDELIDGSMVGGNRRVIASSIATNAIFAGSDAQSMVSYDTRTHMFRSQPRHVWASSIRDRWFDTFLPPPIGVTEINDQYASIITTPVDESVVGGENNDFVIVAVGGVALSGSDNDWIYGYPFEPRYSTLQRQMDPFDKFASARDSNGNAISERILTKVSIGRHFQGHGSALVAEFNRLTSTEDRRWRKAQTGDLSRAYFGIGDKFFVTASLSVTGAPDYRFAGRYNNFVAGIDIRGWKYGIHNGIAEYAKAAFRRGRFGQFRDMLEQRLDGKFFDVTGKNEDEDVQGVPRAGSSVVDVRFVSPVTSKTIKPVKTFSSNMSFEATSSLPFFDFIVRNREDPIASAITTDFSG